MSVGTMWLIGIFLCICCTLIMLPFIRAAKKERDRYYKLAEKELRDKQSRKFEIKELKKERAKMEGEIIKLKEELRQYAQGNLYLKEIDERY